jgi:hypothetical protein
MLLKGELAQQMKDFILQANESTQEDSGKAIEAFCNKLEQLIDQRIKQATITIIPGQIIVVGSPSAQANAIPIILNEAIS